MLRGHPVPSLELTFNELVKFWRPNVYWNRSMSKRSTSNNRSFQKGGRTGGAVINKLVDRLTGKESKTLTDKNNDLEAFKNVAANDELRNATKETKGKPTKQEHRFMPNKMNDEEQKRQATKNVAELSSRVGLHQQVEGEGKHQRRPKYESFMKVAPTRRRSENVFVGGGLDVFKAPPHGTVHQHFTSLHELEWQKGLTSVLEKRDPENGIEEEIENIHSSWHFPIDNEDQHPDEASFADHIFLSHHMDDFPDNVKVQRFMELVMLGLQKNPHLSVQEKEARIDWFKSYFETIPESDLSEVD